MVWRSLDDETLFGTTRLYLLVAWHIHINNELYNEKCLELLRYGILNKRHVEWNLRQLFHANISENWLSMRCCSMKLQYIAFDVSHSNKASAEPFVHRLFYS